MGPNVIDCEEAAWPLGLLSLSLQPRRLATPGLPGRSSLGCRRVRTDLSNLSVIGSNLSVIGLMVSVINCRSLLLFSSGAFCWLLASPVATWCLLCSKCALLSYGVCCRLLKPDLACSCLL